MTRNILIVEDVEICRDALEAALANGSNLKVCSVETAEDALQWLAQNQASALVTDLRLPRMDGFALIEAVRARHVSLPIILISGESDPNIPAHAERVGASAYFSKPYSPAAVLNKLEELIGSPAS